MPYNLTSTGSPYVYDYGTGHIYSSNYGTSVTRTFTIDDDLTQGTHRIMDTNGIFGNETTFKFGLLGSNSGFASGGPAANITETGFTGNGNLLDVHFDPNMTSYKHVYMYAGYEVNTSIEYFRVNLPDNWNAVLAPAGSNGLPNNWGGVFSNFNSNQGNTASENLNSNNYGTFRTQMFIYNAAGTKVASLQFQQFDNGGGDFVFGGGSAPCFVKGARIEMADGSLKNVEDIEQGDWVQTFDNGPRQVIWSGQRRFIETELEQFENLRPIRIPEGAIGNKQSALYSPQHQVMLTSDQAEVMFGVGSEVMATAKSLAEAGVAFVDDTVDEVTYCHIMFDDHELVKSDGMWVESFNPGVEARKALDAESREEVLTIFPELEQVNAPGFANVRPKLNNKEVQVLFG